MVSDGVGRPCGLVVDSSSDRLFWVDHQLGTIESAALNGSERITLVSGENFISRHAKSQVKTTFAVTPVPGEGSIEYHPAATSGFSAL